MDNTAQGIQQLQGAVKGLTKLLQGNKQNTQPQQISQFVPNLNIDNSLPQNSQNQNPANPQGGRGGYRGRGGRGRGRWQGGPVLCYWCRDFLPKEQASHKVTKCPFQSQARDDWWKGQLAAQQGTDSPISNKEN